MATLVAYHIAGKFSLQGIKIHPEYFILVYNNTYGTSLLYSQMKSANIFAMAIWGSTAKFNSCQYFQLYCILAFVATGPSLVCVNLMLQALYAWSWIQQRTSLYL